MQSKNTYLFSIILLLLVFSCKSRKAEEIVLETQKEISTKKTDSVNAEQKTILPGVFQTEMYFPLLRHRKVAVVGNQTSVIEKHHLIDSLLVAGIDVEKVFAPEHGFRGHASAGEHVKSSIDIKTGLPIISLYGKHKKPTPEDLKNIDIIVFDIQDVGARFYTYLSTLHYVMEAAAEQHIPIIVLDRPNPNADYIDGPVMENQYKSFVGLHPVPIVYAMTIGEYAKMLNGEGWLKNAVRADLKIIPIKNYKHGSVYHLPVKPSPNLPNDQAVGLYPSLCLFEGTDISVGRGTDLQFQIIGSPDLPESDFSFIPMPNIGSKWPMHQGKVCYGKDLSKIKIPKKINLKWMIWAYQHHKNKSIFFNKFLEKLIGNSSFRQQIKAGKTAEEIRQTWREGIEDFKKIRTKYLIYE